MRAQQAGPGGALAGCLFWIMSLSAGGVLAACAILPAWFEYWAASRAFGEKTAQLEALETQAVLRDRELEHLRHDAAYIERIARQELGVTKVGVESLVLDVDDVAPLAGPPLPGGQAVAGPPAPDSASGYFSLPELSQRIEQMVRKYPTLSVFVHPATRGPLMVMSFAVLLAAIVLLALPTTRRPRTAAGTGG